MNFIFIVGYTELKEEKEETLFDSDGFIMEDPCHWRDVQDAKLVLTIKKQDVKE